MGWGGVGSDVSLGVALPPLPTCVAFFLSDYFYSFYLFFLSFFWVFLVFLVSFSGFLCIFTLLRHHVIYVINVKTVLTS